MLGLRAHARALSQQWGGILDRLRLQRAEPRFVPSDAERDENTALLEPAYRTYVTDVSTPGMASSLETSSYLLHLCHVLHPRAVIDLGSGFSSYVFRLYAAQADGTSVTSVDDSAEWLEKTATFLRNSGLPDDGLVEWTTFQNPAYDSYELVFHDLAGGDLRESAMGLAISRVAPGGVIVFDDAHHDGHREQMREEARRADIRLFSLRALTVDSINRWAMLGVRSKVADTVSRK
jgi:predicted O-methyltransferase YrrM